MQGRVRDEGPHASAARAPVEIRVPKFGSSSARRSALGALESAMIASALSHVRAASAARIFGTIPPAITTEMAKGFTLYMVKAVFSGRGDELVDLARENLWR